MGWHDTAQVCLNGHMLNSGTSHWPEFNQKFCSRCGAAAVTNCEACKTPIRGFYHVENVFGGSGPPVPAFCHGCGTAYPWTQARLMAARELAMDMTALEPEEREMLAKSLEDLVRDTPRTPLAATRFKRLVTKAGVEAARGFRDILINIVSENAKALIWGIGQAKG